MKADWNAELLDAAVELMGRGGRGGAVRVRGFSMVPSLRPGQRVAVEFAPSDLATGDLLLFRQVDILVVHRLLGEVRRRGGDRYYRTRGDGLPRLDPPVLPDKVVGRVVAIHDGSVWRSVRSTGARWYARGMAWHDLFWAALAVAGRVGDRWLGRIATGRPLERRIAAVDARLLRIVHRLVYHRIHPPVPEPPEARPAPAPVTPEEARGRDDG